MADPNPYAKWAPNPYSQYGLQPIGPADDMHPLEVQGKTLTVEEARAKAPYAAQNAKNEAIKTAAEATKAAREAANSQSDKLDPATTDFYARQVLAGGAIPALGQGKVAAEMRQQIMGRVAQIGQSMGLGGAALATQQAHYKAASHSLNNLEAQRGSIAQNEATALANGQQYMDRSAELPMQGGGPLLNGIVQGLQRYIPLVPGHDTVAAMDAAHNTFVNEYAKVVAGSPSGSGTLSDSARHEAMNTMLNSYDPTQKQRVFEQMKADMENRQKAIDANIAKQYENLTHIPGHDAAVPGVLPGAPNGPGGNPPPPTDGGPTISAASGNTRKVVDTRTGARIDALINSGAWGVANKTLKDQGLPQITPAERKSIEGWMAANPGKRYYGANISHTEDLNLGQKIAGSAPGAFLAAMANSATAGIPGALAGPSGQGALDAMAALHPDASVTGDVVGAMTGMGGAEAAVARKAPAALAKYAPRIADALYGGLQGFNSAQEGDGLSGAAKGAFTSALGGAIGSKVVGGVGALAKGVRNPSVQYLRSLGVPLTIGQAASQSGRLGATVKGLEDAMTSIPGVGNMIDGRRMEGLRGFNKAAFDAAGNPISGVLDAAGNPITNGVTDIGSAGIRQMDAAKSQAYSNALDPVTIDATHPAFVGDVRSAVQSAAAIPNVNGAQDAALASLQSRIGGAVNPATDTISGRGFQEAYRGLARTGRERAAGDYGHEIGQTMRQGQDALAGALDTQHPGAFIDFLNANQANRNLNVLADAVGKAKNTGEVFAPAQLNMADAASTVKLNGKVASASGNRPFYDLTQAGQEVLPSKLPDSGTAKRALVGAVLTGGFGGVGGLTGGQEGAASGSELGLGMTLAMMLGGTKGAQAAATKLMLDRPDLAVTIGNSIQRRSNLGGLLGAAVGAPRSSPFPVGQ